MRVSSRPIDAAGRARLSRSASGPLHVALDLALFEILASIFVLFASAYPNLELHPTILEIESQRNSNLPALPGINLELGDLLVVQEQFARTIGDVIVAIALAVFGNMTAHQKGLAVNYLHIRFIDLGTTLAARFDFRAAQNKTRFETPRYGVIVTGALILTDETRRVGFSLLVSGHGGTN